MKNFSLNLLKINLLKPFVIVVFFLGNFQAIAATNTSSVEQVLESSGLSFLTKYYGKQIEEVVFSIIDNSELLITDQSISQLKSELSQKKFSRILHVEMQAVLSKNLSESDLLFLKNWYETGTGQKIVKAESSVLNPDELLNMFNLREQIVQDESLMEFARNVGDISGVSEAQSQITSNLLAIPFESLINLFVAEERHTIAKAKAGFEKCCQNQLLGDALLPLAYSYRSINLDERAQYFKFLSESSTKAFNRLTLNGLKTGMEKIKRIVDLASQKFMFDDQKLESLIADNNMSLIEEYLTNENINSKSIFLERTPLEVVLKQYPLDEDLVRLVIDKGALVDDDSMHVIVSSGSYELMQYAHEQGGNLVYLVEPTYSYEDEPLETIFSALPVRENDKSISKLTYILSHNIHNEVEKKHVDEYVKRAYKFNSQKILSLFEREGVDLSFLKRTDLHKLTYDKKFTEIKKVFASVSEKQKVDLLKQKDANHATVLGIAVRMQAYDIANFYLSQGAEANDYFDDYPLVGLAISYADHCCEEKSDSNRNNEYQKLRSTLLDQVDMASIPLDTYHPIMLAISENNFELTKYLIDRGSQLFTDEIWGSPVNESVSAEMIELLLDAGIEGRMLDFEGKRLLHGFTDSYEIKNAYEHISADEYLKFRQATRGTNNPEDMTNPVWSESIRTGWNPYKIDDLFSTVDDKFEDGYAPGWTTDRYGTSLTRLSDGRVIEIAGEHEDYYDPDFFIYNDVIVYFPNGEIKIFGYPEDVFAPTDFHSATLVDDEIYIIGNVGYAGARKSGYTPVYVLDTSDYRISKIETTGESPGWISDHHAKLIDGEIVVSRGKIDNGGDEFDVNNQLFKLNLETRIWRHVN